MEILTLDDLKPGETAKIKKMTGNGETDRRLRDIGLEEGVHISLWAVSPFSDPKAFLLGDGVFSFRRSLCKAITVELVRINADKGRKGERRRDKTANGGRGVKGNGADIKDNRSDKGIK